MKISKAQKDALEVVMKLADLNDPNKKEYILTLICGILNLELEGDESITPTITDNPNNTLPIDYKDPFRIIQTSPTRPFVPMDYQLPQIWYNQETEPIQPTAQELRYATEVTCTGDKDYIVHTTNTADVRYNGECEEPIRK